MVTEVALSFDGMSFQYPTRFRARPAPPVFTDFSWTLPAGRTVLLGPNGAGKTTLLSLAATVLRPQTAVAGSRLLGMSLQSHPRSGHVLPEGIIARGGNR